MSNSKTILNKKYLTVETTKNFLNDIEIACKTMELDLFMNLFNKYDLPFVEDFDEVLESIYSVVGSWDISEHGTQLLEVVQFNSKCLFCEFGKTVKVYKWKYQYKTDATLMNSKIHESQIAFTFKIKDSQLFDFGVCNGYLDNEQMDLLNH
jgi:hypothetical protein